MTRRCRICWVYCQIWCCVILQLHGWLIDGFSLVLCTQHQMLPLRLEGSMFLKGFGRGTFIQIFLKRLNCKNYTTWLFLNGTITFWKFCRMSCVKCVEMLVGKNLSCTATNARMQLGTSMFTSLSFIFLISMDVYLLSQQLPNETCFLVYLCYCGELCYHTIQIYTSTQLYYTM